MRRASFLAMCGVALLVAIAGARGLDFAPSDQPHQPPAHRRSRVRPAARGRVVVAATALRRPLVVEALAAGVRRGRDCARQTGVRGAVRFLPWHRRARARRRTRSGPLAGGPCRHRREGAGRLSTHRTSGSRHAGVSRPDRSADRGHCRIPARAARSRQEPRRRPTRWPRSSAMPRPEPRTSTGPAAARRVIRSPATSPASARNTTRRRCRAGS